MLELYDYQVDAVDQARQAFKEFKRILLCVPTGGGKTVIAADIILRAAKRGSILFLVHRRELLNQTVSLLRSLRLNVGICAGGYPKDSYTNCHVVVAMATTLTKRGPEAIPEPYMIVIDEAHHAKATTWTRIINWYPDAFMLGLTATPERLDGKGLHSIFEKLIEGPSMRELIDMGRLAPYRLYGPTILYDREEISIKLGDFNATSLDEKSTQKVIGKVVSCIEQNCKGKTTLVFSVGLRASKQLVADLMAKGISAAHVDGDSDKEFRERMLSQWGKTIDVISNVNLFTEGMDAPACDALVLARPTQSVTMYLQQVGRVLRYQPDKTAYIYDLAGNAPELGLPDEEREWTLQDVPKQKRQESGGPRSKLCDECFAALPVHVKVCHYCGHTLVSKAEVLKEVESPLIEITTRQPPKKKAGTQVCFAMARQGKPLADILKYMERENVTARVIHHLADQFPYIKKEIGNRFG